MFRLKKSDVLFHRVFPSRFADVMFSHKVLILIFLVCGIFGCQTLPEPSPIEKDGEVHGITQGSFRNRWWNYYERGLSFADGNFWNEAESDLKQAIDQRSEDQWRARTYGFHFVDYFPHREMGVIYYKKGLLKEAIDELMVSLAQVKTSKAQLYLDRARKAFIEKSRLDTKPPEVQILSPKNFSQTNALSILIEGIASDDTFVRQIQVGNNIIRVDVSTSQIPFSTEVRLVPGKNDIPVVVTDLMGKSTQVLLTIIVDRAGPIIQIDEPDEGLFVSGAKVSLKGSAYDEAGLAEITINGRKIISDGSVEVKIDQAVTLGPEEKSIVVQTKDGAGNVTTARIALADLAAHPPKEPLSVAKKDSTPPTLQIRNIEKEQSTFLRQALIEGKVSDDGEVKQLFVNDKQILKKSGRKIHFSHLVGLREGKNPVTVRAVDASGNEETVRINIEQMPMKVRDIGSRLRVSVIPFTKRSLGADQQLSFGVEDLLTGAMIDRGRFSAIEREHLEKVLRELKLSDSGLVDEKTALKVGKILAADCILFGDVLERVNSVEAYTRIVDTETAQVLAVEDVYAEDVDITALRNLSKGLELKLTQALPLVEGSVVKNDGGRITLDLGKKTGIKNGMKLFVYEIAESIPQSQAGAGAAGAYREMGQARIQSVMEQISSAQTMEGADIKAIQPNSMVITR